MKQYIKYIQPTVISGLLLYIFLFKGCGDGNDTNVVTIPEVKGSFPVQNNPVPNASPKPEYRYLPGKDRTDTIKVQNPINIGLWNYYVNSEQSKKDSLHADAIGEREYTLYNEDDFLKTTSQIKTRGELLSYQLSEYTLKPRTVEVEDKKTAFSLLGGAEIGSNESLNAFTYKLNLGLQNSKGTIFKASYQRINNDNYYLAGVDVPIWGIRR